MALQKATGTSRKLNKFLDLEFSLGGISVTYHKVILCLKGILFSNVEAAA